MKYIFYIFFFSTTAAHGQRNGDCLILDGKTDTVYCGVKKIIIDLHFCESNGLYQEGLATDLDGKEEFCFYFQYDKKNNLKRVTFWTYEWKNSGYTTKDKIGCLKINGDKKTLIVKRGFILTEDFVNLVTKT